MHTEAMSLQQEVDELRAENARLQQEIANLRSRTVNRLPAPVYGDLTECTQAEEAVYDLVLGVRFVLWHALVRLIDGRLEWQVEVSHEEAARSFLPLAYKPGQSFLEVWHNSIPSDVRDEIDYRSRDAILVGLPGYTQQIPSRGADGQLRWLSEDVRIEPLGPYQWRLVGVIAD